MAGFPHPLPTDGTVTVTRWLGADEPYSVRLWTSSHTAATAFRVDAIPATKFAWAPPESQVQPLLLDQLRELHRKIDLKSQSEFRLEVEKLYIE